MMMPRSVGRDSTNRLNIRFKFFRFERFRNVGNHLMEWQYKNRLHLVTGATGLYGRELVRRLVRKGALVRTVSRGPRPNDNAFNNEQVEHVMGDLKDPLTAKSVMKDAVALFHLAGLRGSIGIQTTHAAELLAGNLMVCFNVLEAARQASLERIAYVSTVTVYPPMAEYREELAWSANPHEGDQYVAWAKRMAEKLLEAQEIQYGKKNYVVVRPVNTFGPFDNFDPDSALVVPALIRRAIEEKGPFVVWGDGSAIRDFLYISDAVDGTLLAFEKGIGLGSFNLGSGCGYSIREVAEMVLEVTGRDLSIEWDLSKPSGEPKKIANIDKARRLLGFAPKISLRDAILETVTWYSTRR